VVTETITTTMFLLCPSNQPWALNLAMAATIGVAIGAAWEAPWRALELALTLRTLTVHLACGWSSYFSNDLGRCAVGITVAAGAARAVTEYCEYRLSTGVAPHS
jgi:hypothetical protein